MGKAERNRRNRRRQPGAAERLRRYGSTGPFRAGSAEARELFEQVVAEDEMPCRATFLDDPLFGSRAARVTGTTPDGGLVTGSGHEADRVPVLLFEPVHTIALTDPVTGLCHEPRIETLVGSGWQRVPPRFVMVGMPADGWGLYRTPTGVELLDPYGCVYAEGRLALDPEWVSAAVSTGAVMVLVGPSLGIRVPPGRTPQSYTDRDRIREFRTGRENGLLAAATVKWHTSPPEQTVTWVLLRENAIGPGTPPVAYVPLLNLKAHGGPKAFGFTDLAGSGREPMEVPTARGLAARITTTDLDLIRPGDDTGGFIAGYRNPGGPADERFAAWREAASRHGRILVITGTRHLDPGQGYAHVLDVIRSSRGAWVPLAGESAATAAPQPAAADTRGDDEDQSEYSELLTRKLRSQESFEVFIAHAVADLIDSGSLSRWLTNLWPVACQTCGEPLGTKADISADGPIGDNRVLISVHHSACRHSGITPPDGRVRMNRPTSSYVAGYLAKAGKPGAHDFPAMVVNPSCEQLLLEQDGAGGWRNATLDEFAAHGLRPATGNFPPQTRQIRADLHDDRLTVTIGADSPTGHMWAISPPPHVCEQLRRYRGFVISLTTKALPTLLTPEDLPGAFNDPEAIVGWVELTRPLRPRRPAIRLPWPRPPHSAETPGLEVDQATELPRTVSLPACRPPQNGGQPAPHYRHPGPS